LGDFWQSFPTAIFEKDVPSMEYSIQRKYITAENRPRKTPSKITQFASNQKE
jgi:hypothetical protein